MAKDFRGAFCVRCEIIAQLAKLHKLMGQNDYRIQLYQQGLELSKQGLESSERHVPDGGGHTRTLLGSLLVVKGRVLIVHSGICLNTYYSVY